MRRRGPGHPVGDVKLLRRAREARHPALPGDATGAEARSSSKPCRTTKAAASSRGVHLQLREDALHVGSDRVHADRHVSRDMGARPPAGQQPQHLALPRRQRGDEQLHVSTLTRRAGEHAPARCSRERHDLSRQRRPDRARKRRDTQILREVASEPRSERVPDLVLVVHRGQCHDHRRGPDLEQTRAHIQPVMSGRPRSTRATSTERCSSFLDRSPAGRHDLDLEAELLERRPDRLGEEPMVLNDQRVDVDPAFRASDAAARNGRDR